MTEGDAQTDGGAVEMIQADRDGVFERDATIQALQERLQGLETQLQNHIASCNCTDDPPSDAGVEDLVKIERIARWSDQELHDLRDQSRLKWLAVQIWSEIPNHFDLIQRPGSDQPRSWKLTRKSVKRAIAVVENKPKSDVYREDARRVLDEEPGWIRRLAEDAVEEPDDAGWMTDDARRERAEAIMVPRDAWIAQRPSNVVEVML